MLITRNENHCHKLHLVYRRHSRSSVSRSVKMKLLDFLEDELFFGTILLHFSVSDTS